MKTKVEPEIFEYFEDGQTLLHIGGACIKKNRALLTWPRKIYITFAHITTPLFQILDIYYQDKENLVPTLALHLGTIWAFFVSAIMILQWYRTKDSIVHSMIRVRQKQLLIGKVDVKLSKTISREFNFSKKITAALICSLVGVTLGGLLRWIFAFRLGMFKREFNKAMVKKYPLPFPLWYPLDYTKTRTTYLLAGMFAVIPYLAVGTCLIGLLSLFYSFTTFGTINFMILNNFLKTLHKGTFQKLGKVNNKEYNNMMKEEMKKCAIYLQEILSYCELIEKTYSTILLLQTFFSCVAVTGSLSMIVFTPKNDSKIIFYLWLFLACLTYTFFFCYFGDRLTQEAEKVREALYFNKWIDADNSFKISMLIVMIRMSKPVTITMGKISPVRLTTFIQILRAAYSFMALLQNRNATI